MADKARITMLGTSQSGKTCFMLGMHAHLQLGVNGFTLRAADDDEELRLTNEFEKLLEPGKDRWPAGQGVGDQRSILFKFCYGFRPFMEFDWLDYRGAALRDEASQADVQALHRHLLESSAVMLCVSGEHLLEPVTPANQMAVARKAFLPGMNSLLTTLHESKKISEQHPFPVIITITKYDLCMDRGRDQIIADIKKLFDPLFRPDSGWLTMICPVSLGTELKDDPFGGTIEPKNMHLPLIFAFYYPLNLALRQEQVTLKETRRLQEAARRELIERSFLAKVFSSGRGMIDEQETEIERIRTTMMSRVRDLRLLTRELQGAQVYRSGAEQEIEEFEVDV